MFLNLFSRKRQAPKTEPDEYLPPDVQQASRDVISRRKSEIARNADQIESLLRRPGLTPKQRADLETRLMQSREEINWLQEAADAAPFATVDPRAEFMERSVQDLRAQAKEHDIPRAEVMTKGQLAEAMVSRQSEATGKPKEGTSRPAEKGGKMSIFSSTSRRIYGLVGGDARTRVFRLTALALLVAVVFPPVAQEMPLYRTGKSEHGPSQGLVSFMWLLRVFDANAVDGNREVKSSELIGVYLDRRYIHYPYLSLELLVILTAGLLTAYSYPYVGEHKKRIG